MKTENNKPKSNFNYGLLYLPVIMLVAASMFFSMKEEKEAIRVSYDPAPTQHYIKSGSSSTNGTLRMLPTKSIHINVTPTASNGGTLDISGFGLTTVGNVQVSAERNTSSPNDVPTVGIKSVTTSTITYNLIQGNNAVVNIAGIYVLSGAPNVFVPTPGDVTLRFQITGW